MTKQACMLFTAAWIFLVTPAWSAPFNFSTGQPDGRLGAAVRIPGGGLIEIEAGDDFITTAGQTTIATASFGGLLTGSASIQNIVQVTVEIYRVFPLDSNNPPDGRVPTRVNSPSDVAFDSRDSSANQLTFTIFAAPAPTALVPLTGASNSVLNGIHPIPNQTTGGEGPISGSSSSPNDIRLDVTFNPPFRLPSGHYFFVPQVRLSTASGSFFWLSTVGNNPPLFTGDLQAWIRNADLDPDWLRIGTDIIGGQPAPTFDMAFSLSGTTETASLVAAVLPLSRSVRVGGAQATAFAAIINVGPATVTNCRPAPPLNPPANLGLFTYQTTNSANALTGTPNTPASIAPGAIQNFVFGFLPTGPIPQTSLAMRFSCDNVADAQQFPGVNNLFLVAETSAVPDTIALISTISGDGIVHVPGSSGTQLFAIGTSNVGATGTIVISADTGGVALPLTLTVCETTGGSVCLAPPTLTVTVNYAGGTNRSFAFFAQASGSIPFDPANNRVFARLTQAGVLRGATSAAVCTTPNTGC